MKQMWAVLVSLTLTLAALSQPFAKAAGATSASVPVPELLAAGRVDDAIAAAQGRIQHSPKDAEGWHLLSRAYFALQKWDKAIEAGERAVALNPNNSPYQLWLGRTYAEKADDSSFFSAGGWAKKARQAFERAVELDSSNLAARSDLIEFYVEAPGILGGGTDKARRAVAEIEDRDPALAHLMKARIAEKDKDYAAAEQEFRAAVTASGGQASYWLNLASFYRRRERYNDMEQAITRAMASSKKRSNALYDAAGLLVRTGRDLGTAADLLRKYLSSGPPDEEAPAFQAHYLLGNILEKQGRKQEAAQEYRAALSLAREFDKAREALKRVETKG